MKRASSLDRSQLVLKGRKSLKRELQKTDDLPATIVAFQKQHGLGSERCEPLIELLRLTDMSRAAIYREILESLTNDLTDQIPTMSKSQQDILLGKTFQFLERDIKELKIVPLTILKQRSDIPDNYLRKFAELEKLSEVLRKLPVPVQQQVWEIEAGAKVFEARVAPLLESYRSKTGAKYMSHANKASFFVSKIPSERLRAQSKELKTLVEIIGSRPGLLDATCKMLMRRFCNSSKENHYGVWASLLSDLLLTYEIQTSVAKPKNLPNRLKLAKVLDQAMSNGNFTESSTIELHKALRSILPPVTQVSFSTAASGRSSGDKNAPKTATNLSSVLEDAWIKLASLDKDKTFLQPVTDDIAPGYSQKIETPMDMSLMRTKIHKNRGSYATFDAFCSDIDLMVRNCWAYNGKDSIYGVKANRLKNNWEKMKDPLRQQILQGPSAGDPPTASISAPMAPPGKAPLLAQNAGNSIEVGAAFMMLAQPSFFSLLIHSLVGSMEEALQRRVLPTNQRLVPILLQLLQISLGARSMVKSQSYEIPSPDLYILRRYLPLVQRYICEVEISAREASGRTGFTTTPVPVPPHMNVAFASPIIRSFAQGVCGASFYRDSRGSSQQPGDTNRAQAILVLFKQCADKAMANDRPFLEALIGACSKQQLPARRSEVRSAVLDFLTTLVEYGGVQSIAHEVTLKLILSWAQLKSRDPWVTVNDVERVVSRLRALGADTAESVVTTEYAKLIEAFPALSTQLKVPMEQ